MRLAWLHRLLVSLLHLERRFDPLVRPLLDGVLRPPAAALIQWFVNARRPNDGLAIAEERVPPGEEAEIDGIIATMRAHLVQDYPPGGMERAGNTKTHALVRAELIVHDDLPASLRRGLFATPRSYPAWVRFAGPGPHVEPDIEDVGFLSFSMKVMGVDGPKLMDDEAHTQDFLAVCTPTFTSADLHANVSLQKWSKRELGLWYFLNPFDHHVCDGLMQGLWTKTQGNPLGEPYYSTVAYLLGEGQAMQYRFRPLTKVSKRVPRLPLRPPDDYLREAMVRTLAATDVEFELSVQLQTDPHRMPVETAQVIWPEKLSPHVSVATLRIPRQRFDSEAQLAFARVLSFNPWHSLAEHRPLGNLGRARRRIYRELAEFRQHSNREAHVEPTGNELFD